MRRYLKLCESEERELLALCRDDGYTWVTESLTVQTSRVNSPNMGAIIDLLQRSSAFVGRSVVIEEVPQSSIDKAMSAQMPNRIIEERGNLGAVERQLHALCQTAVNENSSDVHVMVSADKTLFLLRCVGVRRLIERFHTMQSAKNQPREVGLALIDYVFSTLGGQDITYTRPANDRFSLLLSVSDGVNEEVREFEWRAALIPTFDGPKLTLRCLTPKKKALSLEDMDLPQPYIDTLMAMVNKRQGGIIVTGPMGSGKSSLVHALLEKVDRVARSVHSLEDPVEFSQAFVSKTQVTPTVKTLDGTPLDYAFYCKETLRHDVDISNIGEIRDNATAAQFCRKAETGGLALATLHTNSALGVAQTFIQQLNMPSAMIGAPDLMAMFVHVKLVRQLCECAFSFSECESEPVIRAYEERGRRDELTTKVTQLTDLCSAEELKGVRVLNPNGCAHCNPDKSLSQVSIGERGRVVVMELIVLDDADRQFIINEDDLGWKAHLQEKGWPDIKAHTKSRIVRGQVDILSASEQVDDLVPTQVSERYQVMQKALYETLK